MSENCPHCASLHIAPQVGDRVSTTTNEGERVVGKVSFQSWHSIIIDVEEPAQHIGQRFIADRDRVTFADTVDTHRSPGYRQDSMKPAEIVVHMLLDAVGDEVEVEYHLTSIDTMPHTTWLIRAVGASPTQYLCRGTAHTPEDAQKQVEDKVRLLGVRVARTKDFRNK